MWVEMLEGRNKLEIFGWKRMMILASVRRYDLCPMERQMVKGRNISSFVYEDEPKLHFNISYAPSA
jgi:hypothetical protein